jgi:hypothetical protein
MRRDKTADSHAAMLKILRSLAAWGLRQGVAFGAAERLLRVAYAHAGCDLAHPGNKPKQVNARKIGELTGLIRQSVRALLCEKEDSEALNRARSLQRAQRILWGWHNDRKFHNPDGTPALLPLQGPKSFSELCRLHSGDGGVESKLQTLLAAKAVRQRRDGLLQVTRKTFATSRMDAAGIAAFGQIMSEHVDSFRANSERQEGEQLYSRRIVSRELDKDAADMLLIRLSERADAFGDRIETDWTDEAHAPSPDSQGLHPPYVLQMYLTRMQTAGEEPGGDEEAARGESAEPSQSGRRSKRRTKRKRSHQ